MGLSFMYTYYMLTPEVRKEILPKRAIVHEGRQLTLIYPNDDKADTVETIPWTQVKRVKNSGSARIYILDAPRLHFIMIPLESVKSDSQLDSPAV